VRTLILSFRQLFSWNLVLIPPCTHATHAKHVKETCFGALKKQFGLINACLPPLVLITTFNMISISVGVFCLLVIVYDLYDLQKPTNNWMDAPIFVNSVTLLISVTNYLTINKSFYKYSLNSSAKKHLQRILF